MTAWGGCTAKGRHLAASRAAEAGWEAAQASRESCMEAGLLEDLHDNRRGVVLVVPTQLDRPCTRAGKALLRGLQQRVFVLAPGGLYGGGGCGLAGTPA